jgi:hypothetical protein
MITILTPGNLTGTSKITGGTVIVLIDETAAFSGFRLNAHF